MYYINARMYDSVTARFLQADTYLGSLNDPLSLNLYTYCLNNPHKYTDPSGHIPLLLIGLALLAGAASAKAEFDRQVQEGDNYTNWLSIGVVGISNTLLCLIPGGKFVSAAQAAKAGGTFVFKTFALQFGKAIGLGVASGFAADAGIEVARQLATGRNITNLNQDQIVEAGIVGGICGGAGAIFGAGVELLADTRLGRSIVAKATEAFSKGKDAIKNQFAKIASKNGKRTIREMTGLGEPKVKLNLQFFASQTDNIVGNSDFGNYKFKNGIDVDLRGKGNYNNALDMAFEKTGMSKEEFVVTKWAKNEHAKSFPVEWKAYNGAEVNIDIGHSPYGEAPSIPHVGWQTGGKRGTGGGVRGHIFVDEVPFNR